MPDPRIRVDEWVLPSHTQAARVAEGSLDLAIAWIEEADVERLNLSAHLLWFERLEAVIPRAHEATRHESVPAAEITVLVDVDEASWWSWNRYASTFAKTNHASVTNIEDGGIVGPAFFDHVIRLQRPVLDSPKRHAAPMPPTLTRRPVRSPVPLWAWALLHRADEHPVDGCACDPDAYRPRLDLWLANTTLRAILADSEQVEGLTGSVEGLTGSFAFSQEFC